MARIADYIAFLMVTFVSVSASAQIQEQCMDCVEKEIRQYTSITFNGRKPRRSAVTRRAPVAGPSSMKTSAGDVSSIPGIIQSSLIPARIAIRPTETRGVPSLRRLMMVARFRALPASRAADGRSFSISVTTITD
jgi:hypothetical protein